MKLHIASTVLLTCALAILPGCKRKQGEVIQTKGSDTLVQVAQAWAEAYSKEHPGVSVQVSGGGSGQGLKALTDGSAVIANSSRAIKQKEKDAIKTKFGKDVKEFIVGYDGIAVYVHKDNPVKEISLEELKEIYADGGTYEKWEQLNPGITGPIIRASRNNSSGTYVFFRDAVCGKGNEFRKSGISTLSGSSEVVEFCATTPNAIGYSGMGYKNDSVGWLLVSETKGGEGFLPTPENVLAKKYPIARPLFVYTVGEPEGPVKEYIDWMLSPAGQAIVKKEKFVPLQ